MTKRGDTINAPIGSPIEQAHPADVVFGANGLNSRQQALLERLPGYGSQTVLKKRDVSMLDLSAITAKTGDEFAMFTRKGKRLIVRGDNHNVPIGKMDAIRPRNDGYQWSGHTHPGFGDTSLIPSDGDRQILEAFEQSKSALYNSAGRFSFVE